MVALAAHLVELGVDVRMCLPPDEEFTALVDGTNADLVPIGQSVRALVTSGRAGRPGRPQVAEALSAGTAPTSVASSAAEPTVSDLRPSFSCSLTSMNAWCPGKGQRSSAAEA